MLNNVDRIAIGLQRFSDVTLSDIDECAWRMANDCSEMAICNNTKGSYTCECPPGYSGDGRQCRGDRVYARAYSNRIQSNQFRAVQEAECAVQNNNV